MPMRSLRVPVALLLVGLALGCGMTPGPAPAIAGRLDAAPGAALTPGGPAQPGAFAARGYKPYYGIQHTHVAENGDDGQGTLAEAYTYARDKAKLDFLGVSSHSHMITDDGYAGLKRAAKAFTRAGFVALVAQEWSSISKGGHINIFEADERCALANGDWDGFYKNWLPSHPEVGWVQFNHPHPSNPREFGGLGFSPTGRMRASTVAQDKVAGMALLNGPGQYTGEDMLGKPDDWDRGVNGQNYEGEYVDFLNRGWRIGAVGDQDNHTKTWGLASATRTGVWASSLTKSSLVAAFKARRTFATSDHNLKLWFSIDGADMGDSLRAKGPLKVTVQASDPDTSIARLELWGDVDGVGGKAASVVAKTNVGKKTAKWTLEVPAPSGDALYFAKVVYRGDDAWGWTSPIWVSQ